MLKHFVTLLTFNILITTWLNGQEKEFDLYKLSLEELMNIEVSISTKSNVNIRETPGIVTVITQNEIRCTGARDIVELFHLLVPGFDFGVDVEGVVGMGIRGIWAHEGKYLFMINGFEMNDGMFACVPFVNHFALDNIERIEIIRGPGSALYGGFAGIGVINMITRDAINDGGKITYSLFHTGRQFRQNQLSIGHTIKGDDLLLNISSTFGQGSLSDRSYTDYFGKSRSLINASDTYIKQLALKFDYKNFRIQTLLDDYSYEQVDLWNEVYNGTPLQESFKSNFVDFSYRYSKGGISIEPKMSYKWQKPWRVNIPEIGYGNNKLFTRFSTGISANYRYKTLNVTGGFDANSDR